MNAPRFRVHADGRVAVRLPGWPAWFSPDGGQMPEEPPIAWYLTDADVHGEGWSEAVLATGGCGLITAERQRQIEAEGWSAEHDDGHSGDRWEGALARAGAAYALSSYDSTLADDMWPFHDGWKPRGGSGGHQRPHPGPRTRRRPHRGRDRPSPAGGRGGGRAMTEPLTEVTRPFTSAEERELRRWLTPGLTRITWEDALAHPHTRSGLDKAQAAEWIGAVYQEGGRVLRVVTEPLVPGGVS